MLTEHKLDTLALSLKAVQDADREYDEANKTGCHPGAMANIWEKSRDHRIATRNLAELFMDYGHEVIEAARRSEWRPFSEAPKNTLILVKMSKVNPQTFIAKLNDDGEFKGYIASFYRGELALLFGKMTDEEFPDFNKLFGVTAPDVKDFLEFGVFKLFEPEAM